MTKINMSNMLDIYNILTTNKSFNNTDIKIKFKFDVAILINQLKFYVNQYSTEFTKLMQTYNIEPKENYYYNVNKDEIKLNEFLSKVTELQSIEVEFDHKKNDYDKNAIEISPYEISVIMPFFNFPELEEE